MKKNANKGFSLVELIIVIAIMAVLIGVLAPQFIKHVENSRQSTDMDNVQAVKTAIEAAAADEDITAASITVDGTNITYSISGAASLDGVASSTALKSKGWPTTAETYEYNFSSYTWNSDSYQNTKGKSMDMGDIFK